MVEVKPFDKGRRVVQGEEYSAGEIKISSFERKSDGLRGKSTTESRPCPEINGSAS